MSKSYLSSTRIGAAALVTGVMAAAASPAAAEVRLTMSHHTPPTHIYQATAERMAELAAAATDGELVIDIRPASQLFNLRTSGEALNLGTLDLAWTDLGSLSNMGAPELGFTSLPFLFEDFDHAFRVFDGEVGDMVRENVRNDLNIDILGFAVAGFRVFVTQQPIQSVDDLQGIRLRVPEIPVYVSMARALGTNPTPIPASDIYTALQTGVVDGMEGPPDWVVSERMYEVANHATRTYHILTEGSVMGSVDRLSRLSPEHQTALRDAAREAVEGWYRSEVVDLQSRSWEQVKSRMSGNEDIDIAEFRAKMEPLHEEFMQSAGPRAREYVEGTLAAAN
jgi:tripartite ATP-independent transporter DctP family solute receptor